MLNHAPTKFAEAGGTVQLDCECGRRFIGVDKIDTIQQFTDHIQDVIRRLRTV